MCFNSTIGAMLAKALKCDFLDADDYHSQANKGKSIIQWTMKLPVLDFDIKS